MGKEEEASREDRGGFLIRISLKSNRKEESASREDRKGFLITF